MTKREKAAKLAKKLDYSIRYTEDLNDNLWTEVDESVYIRHNFSGEIRKFDCVACLVDVLQKEWNRKLAENRRNKKAALELYLTQHPEENLWHPYHSPFVKSNGKVVFP